MIDMTGNKLNSRSEKEFLLMAATEFDTTIQKTNLWLKEIMEDEGWEDRQKAYMVLRAVLHALRDRLVVDEAVHLGSQLPMLLRGMYYEGWDPSINPLKIRNKGKFLSRITQGYEGAQIDVDPEEAFREVVGVVARNISEGELDDVRHSLPASIQELWPEKPTPKH